MPPKFMGDESKIEKMIENLSVGMFVFNREGRMVDANPTFLNVFHATSVSDLERKGVPQLLRLLPLIENLNLAANERVVHELEIKIEGSEGVHNILMAVRPFRDAVLGKIFYQGILLDVNDRKLELPASAPETLRDPLTGCFSKLFFPEFEERVKQGSWGCLVAHLDHFRQFRDRHGLGLALEATLKMSRFLMRHVRAGDGIVKMDNDHFVILLENAETSGVNKVARRLRTAALGQAPLRFSLGGASHLPDETLEQTIHRADQDLSPVRVLERTPGRARITVPSNEIRQ